MLIIKLSLICAMLLSADTKWQRITTDEHISFLFPNKAEKLTRVTNNIPSHIYQTKNLVCVFGVVCSDFSNQNPDFLGKDVTQLYEILKKESIAMETAILKSERTVPYENMLIKEIEYSIIKDSYEMTYFKRFIFRDKFVYQISIGGRTRHFENIKENRDIFFNSIHFDEKTKLLNGICL